MPLNRKHKKTKKPTLVDFSCRKLDRQLDMVDFGLDEFSIVKLYKHIKEHFMPHFEYGIEVSRFLCLCAADKELKKRLLEVEKQ